MPDAAATPALTVFHDGACPLCAAEIRLLRRLDRGGRLAFVDVAPPEAAPACPLPQATLLARFHVQRPSGEMLSGARAFFAAWSLLPGLGWLSAIARVPPLVWLAEGAYGLFLKVRPTLQWMAKRRR
jgi:predicted DCC family thiol-disulfide oxidoreductase YuxK